MIIYAITNKINGKQYVGQTTGTLKERFKQHCRKNNCINLYRSIQKYGKENFRIEEIAIAYSIKELNQLEEFYIKELNTLSPNGYNLTTGGDRVVQSEESKLKMSKSHKGMRGLVHSEETKLKISIAHTGKKKSEEHCKNISEGHKGIKHSLETKEKIVQSNIRRWTKTRNKLKLFCIVIILKDSNPNQLELFFNDE